MKILIAVDSSPDSRQAVEVTSRRPWRSGTSIRVIHVVESFIPPLPDLMGVGAEAAGREYAENVARGNELLEEYSGILRDNAESEIEVTSELITAGYKQSPEQVIVEEAERDGSDMVVVGSRGLNTWKRVLVGSVSMAVVQHAPCSVEVIRAKRHA